MTKTLQTGKKISTDQNISRSTKIFLDQRKFLNCRSLLSGTRSNGTATFEKCACENFGQLLEVVLFSGNLEMLGIFCSIGDFISIRHSAQPKENTPAIIGVVCIPRCRVELRINFPAYFQSFRSDEGNFAGKTLKIQVRKINP